MTLERKFPWPNERERRGLRMIRTGDVTNSSDAEAADVWIDRLLETPDSSAEAPRWSKPPTAPSNRPGTRQSISDLSRNGRITPEQGALLYEIRRMLEWKRRPWWDRLISRLLGERP